MTVRPDDITLGMQIAAVEREIRMRRMVYPGQVVKRKMTQTAADVEIAAMMAVLKTLERVRDGNSDKGF